MKERYGELDWKEASDKGKADGKANATNIYLKTLKTKKKSKNKYA